MPDFQLPFENEPLLTYLAAPSGAGPWPGVVVIHDALGMSSDVRKQCDWLASEGFLAAAPDLFAGKTFFRCIFKVLREFKKRKGPRFDKVEAVKQYLLDHPQNNGKVGSSAFVLGGASR
jgi:carboxymethylenebutenolidase